MKRKSKDQPWAAGDLFVVKLSNDKFAVGQVLGHEPGAMDAASIALFDGCLERAEDAERCEVSEARVIFALLATRDLLDMGEWRVVSRKPIELPRRKFPFEKLRRRDWVGAEITGSGNVAEVLEAYFGLAPWDGWYDADYVDQLLYDPSRKPKNVKLRADFPGWRMEG